MFLEATWEPIAINYDNDTKSGSFVCSPIMNVNGEVVAVSQIIEKEGSNDSLSGNNNFTDTDIKVTTTMHCSR